MIKALSKQTSQDLCAQQVITSLPDCIKELVDNSVDAKATYIKIVLTEYGKQKVEVVDNGVGIDDFGFLGKKGTTSKNKGNGQIQYLGFRGEAIHSIGRVSGDLTIQSKCAKDGNRRIFTLPDQSLQEFKEERIVHGEFTFANPNKQGSKNCGTKVTISRLFQKLPVRQLELQSKFKQFLKKTNELIKQFCLIYPDIQFVFINLREGKHDFLIQTSWLKKFDRITWLERIKEMDERMAKNLVYVEGQYYQGYVLNKIESGSSKQNAYIKKNQHYCFVNRRPIDPLPLLVTNLNEIYKKYNHGTKYIFLLNLKLANQHLDLNLTPNKRQIYVRKNILEKVVEELREEIVRKVVEEVPTLKGFQERENGKIKGFIEEKFGSQCLGGDKNSNRKSVFFPNKTQEPALEPEPQKQVKKEEIVINKNKFAPESKSIQKQQEQKKEQRLPKQSFQNISLPKINIDRDKLKERLSSKMSSNFMGVKRAVTPAEVNQIASSYQQPEKQPQIMKKKEQENEEVQRLKRMAQIEKNRREEEDAKLREKFIQEMEQVKLQENEEPVIHRKVTPYQPRDTKQHKQSKQKFHPKQPKPASQRQDQRPKLNLMQQQQLRQKDHFKPNQPLISPQESQSQFQNQPEEIPEEDRHCEQFYTGYDKELEQRVKEKRKSVDMSQVFSQFTNRKMSGASSSYMDEQSQSRSGEMKAQRNPEERSEHPKNEQKMRAEDKPSASSKQEPAAIDDQVRRQLGELAPKSLKKTDFTKFNILGQFNLGFIICSHKGTIYMVDQHAADEKYQFQTNLSKSKNCSFINCFQEKLINSIEADQIHDMHILLEEAGYQYTIIDNAVLKLDRCPVFKNQKLGMEYFDQIVSEQKELQKTKKFMAMCASMACRQAVKVGSTLGKVQMKEEVSNLAILNSPWNCPHGRPTLVQLGKTVNFTEDIKSKKKYDL